MSVQLTCPDCGADLVVRTNRTTGSDFLGCNRFPECGYTSPLTAYLEMRRAGAPVLPGFGE